MKLKPILIVATGGVCLAAGLFWLGRGGSPGWELVAPGRPPADPETQHPVFIRTPDGAPAVDSGLLDYHGNPAMVSCAVCHTTREPNLEINSGEDLQEFHQGLHSDHGGLTCMSCHNPQDYNTLHLAGGRTVEYSAVMMLCAQCHGTQKRDFDRGAHGGMAGHWDLGAGPRVRNNCIDCHDPHAPAYPQVLPVFPPKDRVIPGLHPGAEPDHDS